MKSTTESLFKNTPVKLHKEENSSDYFNKAEHEKLANRSPSPMLKTSEVNKFPVKCKDMEFYIPQKEQIETKRSLVDMQSPEVEEKENNGITIKDILNERSQSREQVDERKSKLDKMKELTKKVQDVTLNGDVNVPLNEDQKNTPFSTNKQKLDMLRTYVNLIKEEIEHIKDDIGSLSNLENECIQLNELMKRIMLSIALGKYI